jgi:hypothetical protein
MRFQNKLHWVGLAALIGLGAVLCAACNRDVRLADRKLRSVTVKAVTHYGVTLDQNGSPQQVAYVLLRAIRDDFLARTEEDREAALDKQFEICAANRIAARNRAYANRDELIYNVVYRWTPTVSHYVHDFETDWEKAKGRFAIGGPRPLQNSEDNSMECEVFMEVDDPSGDPNARVVMVIYLAQDKGFWRVLHLGFDQRRRSIGG